MANAAAALGKDAITKISKEREERGELLKSAQASWAVVLLKDISKEERNDSLYKTMKLLGKLDDPKAIGLETNVLVCTSQTDMGPERNAEALARRDELSEKYPEQAEALETPRRKENAVLDLEPQSSLEDFLEGAKLLPHQQRLKDEGYEEIADLDEAEDNDLLELGLKKVELKRLRRYLDKALRGDPKEAYTKSREA